MKSSDGESGRVPPMIDSRNESYDAIIVGGGIAGIYAAYRLKQMGLSFRVLEAGNGAGGVWHWNRYPGARCDVESLDYSYSFSPDLEQEWTWTERYAPQAEILAYLNHVVDRFDLRQYFAFESRVLSAVFDESAAIWRVSVGDQVYEAQYVLMATGLLSTPIEPDIKGREQFAGDLYFASRWPHHKVDFAGKRVGVIGTGSSGIQIIPAVAREAASVTVFQRTPNYSIPARNGRVDAEKLAQHRSRYREIRDAERKSGLGTYWSAFEVNAALGRDATQEEREREYERRWTRGGQGFMVAYSDLMTDLEINRTCADFVRGKIASTVEDPIKRRILLPKEEEAILCKRLCVDVNYFETYNQDHVDIVDLREEPIAEIAPEGVRTAQSTYPFDILIFATGFDAFTGALEKIDIRGCGGVELKENWKHGPKSYLGVLAAGFPNMFHLNGPLSTVGNYMTVSEMQVDRIADLILFARRENFATIDTSIEAEEAWRDEAGTVADAQPALSTCKSWFLGANVPGKPRAVLAYFGGLHNYDGRWEQLAEAGYSGFEFARKAAPVPVD